MPHGATVLEGSGVLLLGIAAFAVILLSTSIAYGVWAIRRRVRNRAAKSKEHILEPPPRLSPSESESLELGNAFRKRGSRDDPFVFLPHNLASYLPSTPPRALVAGAHAPPMTPPGLPPCKDSNSAMVPIIVITNTPRVHRSIEIQFGNTDPCAFTQAQVEFGQACRRLDPIMEDSVVPDHDTVSTPGPVWTLEEIPDEDVIYSDTKDTCPTEVELVESQGSAILDPSETSPRPTFISKLLSPRKAPNLPTLVITSASMQRGWITASNRTEGADLPSPPNTPTLVLTSPSIHCGLDSDPDERLVRWTDELQSWSEILELEEYEEEAKALLGASFSRSPRQLQTPPRSPIFLQTPFQPRAHASPASAVEQHPLVSQPDEETPGHAQIKEDPKKPFDYAAFHARVAALNPTHPRGEPDVERTVVVDKQPGDAFAASSSSSQSATFDYDQLRTRKRAGTVLSRPRPLNPPPLAIRAPAQARCAVRSRRMPASRPGYI